MGELANLKQSHKRSIATYEDQLQTLQEENAGLKGWQRRATGLSIELEEEKRKYGELEEKMRVVGKGSGGAGGAGAGAGVGDEGGVGHGKEMQRLRDEIKGESCTLMILDHLSGRLHRRRSSIADPLKRSTPFNPGRRLGIKGRR